MERTARGTRPCGPQRPAPRRPACGEHPVLGRRPPQPDFLELAGARLWESSTACCPPSPPRPRVPETNLSFEGGVSPGAEPEGARCPGASPRAHTCRRPAAPPGTHPYLRVPRALSRRRSAAGTERPAPQLGSCQLTGWPGGGSAGALGAGAQGVLPRPPLGGSRGSVEHSLEGLEHKSPAVPPTAPSGGSAGTLAAWRGAPLGCLP